MSENSYLRIVEQHQIERANAAFGLFLKQGPPGLSPAGIGCIPGHGVPRSTPGHRNGRC